MLAEVNERRNNPIPVTLMGSNAITGALARMSKYNNHSCEALDASFSSEFGEWDDWDNGHSDISN